MTSVRPIVNASSLGFGGGKPVSNRTARKFAARRRGLPGYPWEGTFKTAEEVEEYLGSDRITCLLCGRAFRALATHILKIHQVGVEEYKLRYGLRWGRGLTCEDARERRSEVVRNRPVPKGRGEWLARGRAKMAAEGYKPRKKMPYIVDQQTLRVAGKVVSDSFGQAEAEEFLRRVATGRTIMEVAADEDMPGATWFKHFKSITPEFRARFDQVWETLPFEVQARAQRLGDRFERALRELFDRGVSDKKAAALLGVTAMACNRRTKKWREEAARRAATPAGCGSLHPHIANGADA